MARPVTRRPQTECRDAWSLIQGRTDAGYCSVTAPGSVCILDKVVR